MAAANTYGASSGYLMTEEPDIRVTNIFDSKIDIENQHYQSVVETEGNAYGRLSEDLGLASSNPSNQT